MHADIRLKTAPYEELDHHSSIHDYIPDYFPGMREFNYIGTGNL